MPTPLALAWFRAKDYQRIRDICADEMMPTFAAFEAKMAKVIPEFEARGIRLQKVIVDPDELLAFAKEMGAGKIDTKVRSAFAAAMLHRQQSD